MFCICKYLYWGVGEAHCGMESWFNGQAAKNLFEGQNR